MELGTKLKNARIACDLSQEKVAEEIGVSRQTLSSWENQKTYPDIISLIKLSDLYTISLDTLLKEENRPSSYVDYIDKAITLIKNKRKIYKCVEIGIYLALIITYIILFWSAPNTETQNEITITMCSFLIPCVIVFISLIIGIDEAWGKYRWFLILFFGISFCWAQEFTITFGFIAEDITWLIYSLLSPTGYATGAFLSFVGLGIGSLARKFNGK